MSGSRDQLLEVLREAGMSSRQTPLQWDILVRQGYRSNLLSRLAWTLQGRGLLESALPPARPHLVSAIAMGERQKVAIRWEVERIRAALESTSVPIVLLKGAAYVMAGLPAADGRLFSDVDILVPERSIPEVEAALMLEGWNTGHHGPYYQRYYRKWMHEIPPMRHARRSTVIDVHHALLPRTARVKVDSDRVREASVALAGDERLRVLAPVDMVLHSATHLFHEGELGNGLRDLFDLDSLLRHFGAKEGFWDRLVPRAAEVGLARPLYYALRYATRLLATPVRDDVMEAAVGGGPNAALRAVADFAYLRALRPDHATCDDRWTALARFLLYVRSHWIRMPLPLLVYHLARKALVDDVAETREPTKQADEQGG